MRVFLVFIALVGAYFFGMVSMLHLVNKISPAAYFALQQDIKWRKAEAKSKAAMEKEKEGKQDEGDA